MRKLASAALLGIAVASCGTRDDNRLGAGFIADLGDQKAVRYVTLAADSSTDFQSDTQASDAGNSPALTVGSQAGTFVRSLLQFARGALPDSGVAVDSAWVRLTYSDGIGTPDSSLAVVLHQVTSSWAESPLPDPFPGLLPAADTVTFRIASAGDTLLVPVTSLAQTWIDHPDSNLGMAFVPLDSSGVLLEYSSRNTTSAPVLEVHWTTDGVDQSAIASDSLDVSPILKTGAFVALNGQPERLTVGRGIPTSTLLRFPLPDLPERATVDRAVLTLYIDPALSNYNGFTARFQRVTAEPWDEDSTKVGAVAYALMTIPAGADSVRFELGSLVTAIEQNDNFGFLLRANDNRPDCDYVRFYGPDASTPGLAPLLQLWYTPGEEGTP